MSFERGSDIYNSLTPLAQKNYDYIMGQRKYFIEPQDYSNAGFFDWLLSKGTNFTCFVTSFNETTIDPLYNVKSNIDYARTILYALLKPIQSQFFYWTITMGDIVEKLGELLGDYYRYENNECVSKLSFTEQHPLKWFLTRQINSFFWHAGEIIGDWYPVLRTKAVAKEGDLMKYVYISCIVYNITKFSVPISQLFVSPSKLYLNDGRYNADFVNEYYNYYWFIQALVIVTSLIYDGVVYVVLKKELFNKVTTEYGFIKKFRLISEYRICVSLVIGLIGLPIALLSSIAKIVTFHDLQLRAINFSIEDFRIVVINVQYMIIFIDQILLLNTRNDRSRTESYTCTCSSCSCRKSNNLNSEDYYDDYDDYDDSDKDKTFSYYPGNNKNNYPSMNRNYIRTNTSPTTIQHYTFSDINRMKLHNKNNLY
ncbi:hypothetical protein PIROE2DRAFT_19416 [Piromyces sp. E2]|nr:hypothetical protein PIROE2DRAFT_19416 [Piromyces sp. E2]|eukprot:OUM56124.1 hypothetical protein PIROE2DRAFT_19416 [Piromyces sp. E2]